MDIYKIYVKYIYFHIFYENGLERLCTIFFLFREFIECFSSESKNQVNVQNVSSSSLSLLKCSIFPIL